MPPWPTEKSQRASVLAVIKAPIRMSFFMVIRWEWVSRAEVISSVLIEQLLSDSVRCVWFLPQLRLLSWEPGWLAAGLSGRQSRAVWPRQSCQGCVFHCKGRAARYLWWGFRIGLWGLQRNAWGYWEAVSGVAAGNCGRGSSASAGPCFPWGTQVFPLEGSPWGL